MRRSVSASMVMPSLRRILPLVLLACWISPGGAALAAPGGAAPAARRLIVLLEGKAGAPGPEEVVGAVQRHGTVPGGLGVGNPSEARLLIPSADRRRSATDNPGDDDPSAVLARYVVLSYPAVVNLDAIRQALERNPHVLYVGEDGEFSLSATPNDPLFPSVDGSGNPRTPSQYQWGSSSLHLPEAWDYNKGHAYVGVIDGGLDATHPDLQAFHTQSGTTVYDGGNFRPRLSFDYGYPAESPNSVNEGDSELELGSVRNVDIAGHGTHVSGIIGATANNSAGVAGGCWNCSLLISKVTHLGFTTAGTWANAQISQSDAAAGLNGAIQKGAQVLNMSSGWREDADNTTPDPPNCGTTSSDPLCQALQLAVYRDVTVVAASGNDASSTLDFPARDSRVIAVGGITSTGSLWNDCPGGDCGSNYSSSQIVGPAKQILSTFYRNIFYSGTGSTCPGFDPYGLCTGTSMASPYIAASAGILRSVNPLLTRDNIKSLLSLNLENPVGWSSSNGIGKPHVGNAVKAALGTVGGQVLPNRLTPLFSLYSDNAQDWLYTAVPQVAVSAILDSGKDYYTLGTGTPGYSYFPGIYPNGPSPCLISCLPKASVYIFTGDRRPYAGTPALVPLYRMTYKSSTTADWDTTYTTDAAGLVAFKGVGYELDGIEGYIYQRCTPEPSCIPTGAVRLYRLYNATRDDFAIFPESQLATMQAAGYASSPGLNDVIGYVYPNVDSDNDGLIDGFEQVTGTSPSTADSDCDGTNDGAEALSFGTSGYGNPLVGTCAAPAVFSDVASGTFKPFIESLFFSRVTGGCPGSPRQYCPNNALTRADVAVFLIAAKGPVSFSLPAANCGSPRFTDVACTAPEAPYIEEFARRGITNGCSSTTYCPNDVVSRGTMAYFLLATAGITPGACTGMFADVPCTAWYAPWVEEMARRGITSGCGGGNFCPNDATLRSQMAVFVQRTFNLP